MRIKCNHCPEEAVQFILGRRGDRCRFEKRCNAHQVGPLGLGLKKGMAWEWREVSEQEYVVAKQEYVVARVQES